jgi:hypothetical protein
MADRNAADETGGDKVEPQDARRSFLRGVEPREAALVVGVATMAVATAASSTSSLAGLVAAAAMAALTFTMPRGGNE